MQPNILSLLQRKQKEFYIFFDNKKNLILYTVLHVIICLVPVSSVYLHLVLSVHGHMQHMQNHKLGAI